MHGAQQLPSNHVRVHVILLGTCNVLAAIYAAFIVAFWLRFCAVTVLSAAHDAPTLTILLAVAFAVYQHCHGAPTAACWLAPAATATA